MSSTEPLETEPELITAQDLPENQNNKAESEESVDGQSDTESETSETESLWKQVPDSELHVILVDDHPRYYAKTVEEARSKIWDIVKVIAEIHPDWKYYTVQVSENEYQITRVYKWWVMQYEQIYRTLRIEPISQIEFSFPEEEPENKKD
jgi:hypothetical protein